MDTVEQAFTKINRKTFVPENLRGQTDLDFPLPIGFGQTNSQPTTVKLMLEWLDVKPGQKILDIGSGSGWTTALLELLQDQTGPSSVLKEYRNY